MAVEDDRLRTIQLDRVRWSLAKLWFSLAGIIFLILILQSIFGKYSAKVEEVWGWALPTILPTLSLIITVLGASALEKERDETYVRRNYYRITFWLSLAYLMLILAIILIEPFTTREPVELMQLSSLWLGPFQGLVASAIGVLFFTKERSRPQPRGGE